MSNDFRDKCEEFGKKGNVGTKLFIAGASGLISVLIIMAGFNGCQGKGIIGDLTTTTSSTDSSNDNSFDTDPVTDSTQDATESYYDNMAELVNEDVYNILLKAKSNYSMLLDNGDSVSEKLINNGVKLNINDSGFIDDNIKLLYDYICKYITCYDEKKFDKCCDYATSIADFYSVFSKDYLYFMLVSSNLDEKYQSGIKTDEFGNISYQYNNICLDNGKYMRFIGGTDEIVGDDLSDDTVSKLKWIERIPRLLFNKYSQFKDSDDICYIVNETRVSDTFTSEINSIISEGADTYDFDKNNVSIKSVNDQLVFVDENGNACGLLSYNQSNVYNKITDIRNSISNKSGDVLLLDSYVSDLYKNDTTYTYNK